jgi:hypothetical protein
LGSRGGAAFAEETASPFSSSPGAKEQRRIGFTTCFGTFYYFSGVGWNTKAQRKYMKHSFYSILTYYVNLPSVLLAYQQPGTRHKGPLRDRLDYIGVPYGYITAFTSILLIHLILPLSSLGAGF